MSASGITTGVDGSKTSGSPVFFTRARIFAVTIASLSGVSIKRSLMLAMCGKCFSTSNGVTLANKVTWP